MKAGGTLDRRAVVASLLADRKDLLVVAGLGSAAFDTMAAGDHDLNFCLWGGMGSAAMIGFGLAMAKPDRPVLVLTGDGEMLMGFGSLATIAVNKPGNLTLVVLDNEHYGETGMQPSHAAQGIDIDKVASVCGFDWTATIIDMAGVSDLSKRIHTGDGLKLATIKIKPEMAPRVLPPRDGIYLKNRFRAALGFGTI
jgi:thiamine pyrophosphate-dependent acetolactate synthase large subunit-like protein